MEEFKANINIWYIFNLKLGEEYDSSYKSSITNSIK
jgi:hypothetical protein